MSLNIFILMTVLYVMSVSIINNVTKIKFVLSGESSEIFFHLQNEIFHTLS